MKKYGTDKILINSSADWGISDPLSVPKTALEMNSNGFSDKEIEKVILDVIGMQGFDYLKTQNPL